MNGVQDLPDIRFADGDGLGLLPGAAPAAPVETEVARKIENSIATLQGVKHIYTNILDGVATITIEVHPREKRGGGYTKELRDAVSGSRRPAGGFARPRHLQSRHGRAANRHLCGFVRRHGNDEAVSWFIDNTVIAHP